MKNLLFSLFLLLSINIFGQSLEEDFKNQIKNQTIVGKSIKGRQVIYTFAQNGNTAILRDNTGRYNHEFIKMCGDIAIYKEYHVFNIFYTGFQINGDTIYVTSNNDIGGLKLKKDNNIPQQIAEELPSKALSFVFK